MTSITTLNYWSDTNIAGKIHVMEIQEKEEMACWTVTYIEGYLLPGNIILTEKNKIIFLESCNFDILIQYIRNY